MKKEIKSGQSLCNLYLRKYFDKKAVNKETGYLPHK